MKSIMVLLHDDAGLEARLQVSLDLAEALHSQLVCLDLTIPICSVGEDPYFGEMILEDRVDDTIKRVARQRIEKSGLPYHWIERRGDLVKEVTSLAMLADTFILSTHKGDFLPDMRQAIGSLLVHSSKRVIAVPQSTTGLHVGGDAMLLWDGSGTAHAAMAAAMPLFRCAGKVIILEIDDGSVAVPAMYAANYLAQHDIRHEIRSIQANGERALKPILDHITLIQPAYVVMGGYGHSRLLEKLFGGMTEHLLKESPVPVFLKH